MRRRLPVGARTALSGGTGPRQRRARCGSRDRRAGRARPRPARDRIAARVISDGTTTASVSCTARSSWRRRSATRNASGRPGTTWSRPTSSPDGPRRRRRWRARASLTSRTWAYVAPTRRSRRVSTPWRWWRSVGGPRPTPSARRCSAATSTRTSPCPSTSPGCSSWCAAATTNTRTACWATWPTPSAGNAYATAVCAAWEAELALWRREWSRARAAVDRARTTIAATDEVMLELRLAGVAARVEADHFDWTRAGAGKPDRGAAVERTERAVRGAETLLTRVEEAVGGPSVPFHRSLAFARAEGARLSAPPSADPWMALVDDDGGDPYFAAYAPLAGRRGAARRRRPQLEERSRGSPAGGGDGGECAGRRTARCRGRWSGAPRPGS